jgi:hypothetical protein
MSYSFTVKAETKADAKGMVADKLIDVVTQQPVHATDAHKAQAVVNAYIDMLVDDAAMDIHVSVSGYVQWTGADDKAITAANVSVNASLMKRVVA